MNFFSNIWKKNCAVSKCNLVWHTADRCRWGRWVRTEMMLLGLCPCKSDAILNICCNIVCNIISFTQGKITDMELILSWYPVLSKSSTYASKHWSLCVDSVYEKLLILTKTIWKYHRGPVLEPQCSLLCKVNNQNMQASYDSASKKLTVNNEQVITLHLLL